MVSAGRGWTDEALIHADLREEDAVHRGEDITLIEGECATGGDQIAKAFARDVLGWDIEPYPADWKQHGRAAGPIRNQQMVDSRPDVLYAYPTPESVGTWDAVRRARQAGVPAHVRRREVYA